LPALNRNFFTQTEHAAGCKCHPRSNGPLARRVNDPMATGKAAVDKLEKKLNFGTGINRF